jgi:RNA polymerase-binding transcription factor DksA
MEVGAPCAEVLCVHTYILREEDDVDRTEARERLLKLREEFTGTVEPIRRRLADSQEESGGEISLADQHPADAATETADRELDTSREAMFSARLRQIDDAIARVDRGTYGTCLVCGKPIPDERLALMPDTPYCVQDAQREQSRAS